MDQPAMESLNETQAAEGIESLLGDDTIDEIIPEETATETEATEDEAQDEPEEASEDAENTEEEEAEEEPAEDTEEPDPIETLAELAEALELSPEEVMTTLKTTVKVQGEDVEVTLKEAFDGYQKDADYRQKTQELSTNRQQFENELGQARQVLENQYQQAGFILRQVEQMVVPQIDQATLDYYKETDPSQYLILKNEREEKAQQFQQLTAAAQQNFNQVAAQRQQQSQAQLAQVMARGAEELPARIPDWSPETKAAIDSYLTSENYGYTPDQLGQISDPRLVELAYKAYQFDQIGKEAGVVTKKVKTLPKIQKPSASVKKPKGSNLKKAKARLGKSGSLDDAAKGIEQLFS